MLKIRKVKYLKTAKKKDAEKAKIRTEIRKVISNKLGKIIFIEKNTT